MLTPEQIEKNKLEFIELVRSIHREGMDTEGLIKKLENSDFFVAPASTIYHNAYDGGLCEHSLNVYYTLNKFVNQFFPPSYKTETLENGTVEYVKNEDGEFIIETAQYSADTIKIVALFHDFSKMNFYEKTVMNKKIYNPAGSKSDEVGKFDWVAIPGFKVRETKEQFIYGTHGQNSEYMTGTFIPLTLEESVAIINHHSSYDNPNINISAIYNKYSLACMLHLADMASTYILEKI